MHSRAHDFLTQPPQLHSAIASKLILSHSPGVTTKCAMCSFQPQKNYSGTRGPSPHLGTAMHTPLFPLSFGKSFMKIRSAVPENGCLVFLWRTEKAIESAYTISGQQQLGPYLAPFQRYGGLNVENRQFCLPLGPFLFRLKFGGVPFGVDPSLWGLQRVKWLANQPYNYFRRIPTYRL